jgi:hypothetical protein
VLPPSRPGVEYKLSRENLVPNAKGEIMHFPPHAEESALFVHDSKAGKKCSEYKADFECTGSAQGLLGCVMGCGFHGPESSVMFASSLWATNLRSF